MKPFAVVVTMLLLFVAAPLFGQDRNIQLNVFLSQAEFEENEFDTGFVTEFEEGSGLGGSINYHFGRWFAIEGAVFALRGDAGLLFEDQAAFDLGKLNLTVFNAGVQLHPLGGRFDPYIGAGGAYVIGDDFHTSDLDLVGIGRVELDGDFTYYYGAGIGIQISEGFGIVVDGRIVPYEPSSRSSITGVEQDLEISPRILSAGVRLRF
jgi:opacity protein-like surface antigen